MLLRMLQAFSLVLDGSQQAMLLATANLHADACNIDIE